MRSPTRQIRVHAAVSVCKPCPNRLTFRQNFADLLHFPSSASGSSIRTLGCPTMVTTCREAIFSFWSLASGHISAASTSGSQPSRQRHLRRTQIFPPLLAFRRLRDPRNSRVRQPHPRNMLEVWTALRAYPWEKLVPAARAWPKAHSPSTSSRLSGSVATYLGCWVCSGLLRFATCTRLSPDLILQRPSTVLKPDAV